MDTHTTSSTAASAPSATVPAEHAVQHDASAAPHDMSIEEAHAAMPDEKQPTIGFIIPFPTYLKQVASDHLESEKKKKATIPPFLIYHPPAARLQKPAEGEKESMVDKAIRKWQTEEDEARGKTNLKSKAVGLIGKGMSMTKNSGIEFLTRTPNKKKLIEIRLLYPDVYPPDNLKTDFNALITQTKKGARKNSIIATTLTPFALAFDTLSFIPGPFEICCVWASSSWIGTQRSTAIANGVTSEKVPLNFAPTGKLSAFTYRLHEIVSHLLPRDDIGPPSFIGQQGTPKRGNELAGIILELLQEQLGGDLSSYDTDKTRIGEDIEDILEKAGKEYAKAVKEHKK